MPEAARIVVTIKSDKLMTLINRCCMNASPRTSAATLRMIIEQTRQKNVTAGSAGMVGASNSYKIRIAVPSMATQVSVPVRHAPVSMFIRFRLMSGCGTGVWP
jgi:hypothetical protein